MSINLMPPVFNQLPLFEANQVLTFGHLNDMVNYLGQQTRFSRSKLVGTGIVCGLSFRWTPLSQGKAEVLIEEGIAVTSAGFLPLYTQPQKDGAVVTYKHRRDFNRLDRFTPFNQPGLLANSTIYELITESEFQAEKIVPKAELADTDKTDRVLVLLFDPEEIKVAKCLDESCDDKGKVIKYSIRPLLIPKTIIDTLNNQVATGRGWKATSEVRFSLDYLKMPNVLAGVDFQNIQTPAAFAAMYLNRLDAALVSNMAQKIDGLAVAFPWIFNDAVNCLKTEIPDLNGMTPGALLVKRAMDFRNNAANHLHIQYLFDFLRDVKDAYNELFDAVSSLESECGGNENLFPFHIMLGIPQTNDTLACLKEQKFSENQFRYRSYFTASPVMAGQHHLYESILFLHKRLARMINGFEVLTGSANDVVVTPSAGFEQPLQNRAIPFYFKQVSNAGLNLVWNEALTRRNKTAHILGYRLNSQPNLLKNDTAPHDFFRIEAVTGKPVQDVVLDIINIRREYHLPFRVKKVPLNPEAPKTGKCSWPDLEADFGYYKDRALGYLEELMAWVKAFEARINKALHLEKGILEQLLEEMQKMLMETNCVIDFPYDQWKKKYTEFFRILFEFYADEQDADDDTRGSLHVLNSVQNILNIWLFAPIYKIWYALMHRLAVLHPEPPKSLSGTPEYFYGMEHLAGVRRGQTLLLVYDNQTNLVLGDFNMPVAADCDCGCTAGPCKDKPTVVVPPLEKPVIMVVYPFEREVFKGKEPDELYPFSKLFAIPDDEKGIFYLELDDMGFYKADTEIKDIIKVYDDKGEEPEWIKAKWKKNKSIFYFIVPEDRALLQGGVYLYHYELFGDFEGEKVTGRFILIIAGVLEQSVKDEKRDGIFKADMNLTRKTPYYPYAPQAKTNYTYKMEVDYPVTEKVIGREKIRTFTTPNLNEVGIYTDDKGNDYLKLLKAAQPGLEEIPFVLKGGKESIRSSFALNVVVNHEEQVVAGGITGRVVNDKGEPLANARVIAASGIEVLTDAEGNYLLEGVKNGEVVRVESMNYKPFQLQANAQGVAEARLEPEKGAATLKTIENLEVNALFKTISKRIKPGSFGPDMMK